MSDVVGAAMKDRCDVSIDRNHLERTRLSEHEAKRGSNDAKDDEDCTDHESIDDSVLSGGFASEHSSLFDRREESVLMKVER